MAEQQQQRQQLVKEVATTNVPQEVDYIDGIIAIDLLSQIGWIDVTHPDLVFDFKLFTDYEINNEGRIIHLTLGHGPYRRRRPNGRYAWINPQQDFSQILRWVLPGLISRLTMLQNLNLWKCQSIPINLNLPNLAYFLLSDCDEGIMNSNINRTSIMKLPAVRKLVLVDFNLAPNNTSSVITFMKKLPSLYYLGFADDSRSKIGREERRSCVPFLQLLRNDKCCAFLKHKLKFLWIEGFIMTKEDIVSLFNDVLPTFPYIYDISLRNNQIETLEDISNSIVNPSSNTRRNLISIMINDNPVENKLINNHENERKAVLNILSIYNRVSCIGVELIDDSIHETNLDKYGPDIEYALRINAAGRILIENVPLPAVTAAAAAAAAAPDINGMVQSSTIPLAVWPIVLEREAVAQPRVPLQGLNQYTGLFYLLQNNQPYIEYIANLNAKNLTKEEEDATTININAINAFADAFSAGTTTSSLQPQESNNDTPVPVDAVTTITRRTAESSLREPIETQKSAWCRCCCIIGIIGIISRNSSNECRNNRRRRRLRRLRHANDDHADDSDNL